MVLQFKVQYQSPQLTHSSCSKARTSKHTEEYVRTAMRVQGLDAVKYWPAYANGLQHLPQQATGNHIKGLLEIYKAGVQVAMRLCLLVNQGL